MAFNSLIQWPYITWHFSSFYSVKTCKSDSFKLFGRDFSFLYERLTFKNPVHDVLKVFMIGYCSTGQQRKVAITAFIEGEKGDIYLNQQCTVNFRLSVNECIWEVKRQKFIEESDYLVKGNSENVTFICIFGPVGETINCMKVKETSIVKAQGTTNFGGYKSISVDLTKMLGKESFSDIVLKCEDESYPAHKVILSARSPVFAAMFEHDMLENREGIVNIQDMNAEAFSQLLKYMYSGKLPPLSEHTAPLLYKVGDKYGIEMLKKDCASYMTNILSISNVCNFLVLSDACCDEEFKKGIINFLIKEAGHIFKQDCWRKFQRDHPLLAVDVYDASYNTSD